MSRKAIAVEKFDCPYCKEPPGKPCRHKSGYRGEVIKRPHPERMDEARKAGY
jgi:hypothetical protein